MQIAGLNFTWGKKHIENARWHLGLFCLYRQSVSPVTREVRAVTDASKHIYPLALSINVKALGAWLGVLGISAYLGGAALILHLAQKRPHNLITYSDLVSPLRWSHLRELRGQAGLAEARDQLAAGDFGPAFLNLRVGLGRYPADTNARLTLAAVYIAIHQRAQADRILLNAFDHGYPGIDYIETAANLLKEADNIEGLLQFCDFAESSRATQSASSVREAQLIHTIHINALMSAGRYDEALALTENFPSRAPFMLAKIKTLLALHAKDLAAAEPALNEWMTLAPKSKSALAALLRSRRLAGNIPEMQTVITRMHDAAPLNPDYVTVGLSEYWLAGADEQAAPLLEAGLLHFSAKPAPLLAWTRVAVDAGQETAINRLEASMTEHGFDLQRFLLTRLLGQIKRRQWDRALATVQRLENLPSPLEKTVGSALQTSKALITICTQSDGSGDGDKLVLTDTLNRQRASLPFYKLLIEALLAEKRTDSASNVIALAIGEFPASAYFAAKEAEAQALMLGHENIPSQPSVTNTPTVAGTPDTKHGLQGVDELLATLAKLGADGKPEQALDTIRSIRKSPPSWLDDTAAEKLAWPEVLFSAQSNNLALLSLNLRTYLRKNPTRFDQVLTQAQTWFSNHQKSVAMIAGREILRIQYDYQPALDALSRWEPPSEMTARSGGTALPDAQLQPVEPRPAVEE